MVWESHPLGERGTLVREGLELVALRMPSPHASAPPVFFLSGGPGESAIQYASHPPFRATFEAVNQVADLYLIEQRGCGQSAPATRVPAPSVTPNDLASEDAYREFWLRHLAAQPRIETPLNALASADDLIAWADAIGAPKIQLWALSYGTHLAQHTLRRHPERIARAAFGGFEGPDQTYKLPSRIQAALDRLDLKVPEEPLNLDWRGERYEIDPFVQKHLVTSWFGLSNRIELLRGFLRGEKQVEALDRYAKVWERPLTFYRKDAASGATSNRLAQIAAEAQAHPIDNAANFLFPEVGPLLGAEDVGDVNRQPLATDHPILIFTGELDGFTPTANFLESAALLPNAIHREIPGAFHNDLLTFPGAADSYRSWFSSG